MTIPPIGDNVPPNAPEPELPAWARRRAPTNQIPDTEFAVFIGRKWEGTYRRKFAPFLEDSSFVPTWNWSAALSAGIAMPFWFLYRKLYLVFAAFFMLPSFALRWLTQSDTILTRANVQAPENRSLVMMLLAVLLSSAIAAGGTANWFLFRRARAATKLVSMQQLPQPEAMSLLQRIGGVNRGGTILFVTLSLVLGIAQALA